MSLLKQMWWLLGPRQRRQLVVLLLYSIAMACSTLSGIAAVLPFFSVLSRPESIHQNRILSALYAHLQFQSERSFIVALGVGFAALVVIANAINLAGALAINRYAYSVGNGLNKALFHEYLSRDYGLHVSTSSEVLSSNIQFEVARVSAIIQHGLLLSSSSITVLFIFTSILAFNPVIATCAIGGLGGSYLAIYALTRRKLLRNGKLHGGFIAERNKIVTESLGAFKEISILQNQEFFSRRFVAACEMIARTGASTQAIAQTPRYILECITAAGLVTVALLISASGGDSAPWLAQLTFIGFAAYRLLPALHQAFHAIVTIRADSSALGHIANELLQARERGNTRSVPVRPDDWAGRPQREVTLRDVTFRYVSHGALAVDSVTLRIPAGDAIGLIGPNGSGKTTLVDLILGLLVPESGQLLVDGIPIDESNRRDWQTTVAYVPQQIALLDTTVAENIALGCARDQIDLERLKAAAHAARLDEFVLRLRSGYDEVLGSRGARLSGGQRQRIGIARALYRNASLLVMDEPTHGLDQSVEQELLTVLASLRRRCTLILIAHGLSTLRYCDSIHELGSGRIVRSGTYATFRTPIRQGASTDQRLRNATE